jgi:uncharacterized phage infection (PIP) family protein YhgE
VNLSGTIRRLLGLDALDQRLNRIDQHLEIVAQAIRIYGDRIVSQQDDFNAALTNVAKAVSDLPGRLTTIDVPAAVTALNGLADQINAINPAAPVAPPAA